MFTMFSLLFVDIVIAFSPLVYSYPVKPDKNFSSSTSIVSL